MFTWFMRGLRDALDSIRGRSARRHELPAPFPGPAPVVIGGLDEIDVGALADFLRGAGIWTASGPGSAEESPEFARFAGVWLESWRDWQEEGVPAEELDRMIGEFRRSATELLENRPATSPIWALESPVAVELLPFLERAIPGFRFIHLVRDGRDGARAAAHDLLRQADDEARIDAAIHLALQTWGQVNVAARDYAERELGPEGRYLLLRAEDFAAASDRLGAFLGREDQALGPLPHLARPSWHDGAGEESEALISRLDAADTSALRTFGYRPSQAP